MPKASAFHTTSEEYSADHRTVYHDNDKCDYGAEIKPQHRGRPRNRRSRSLRSLR
jgi:hypothetical protein